MRRNLTLLVALAGTFALLQCSQFGSSSDAVAADASSEGTAPEASVVDAAAITPGSGLDSGIVDAAPPNLLSNPSFEDGQCANWVSGAHMTATASQDSHSGAKACLVCYNDPDAGDNVLGQLRPYSLPAESILKGSVWVKLAATDGGAGDAGAINMEARVFGFAAGPAVVGSFSGVTTVLSEWREVRFGDVRVPEGGITEVQARVYSVEQNGACFLVDDALLYVAK
jgi:hypothetical protein